MALPITQINPYSNEKLRLNVTYAEELRKVNVSAAMFCGNSLFKKHPHAFMLRRSPYSTYRSRLSLYLQFGMGCSCDVKC